MKPDEPTPPPGQPTPDIPPASLSAVRIGRRKTAPPASGKAGDLTQQLGSDAPADAQSGARPAPAVGSPPPSAPAAPPPTPNPEPEPPRASVPALAPKPPRPAAPGASAEPPLAVAPPSANSARLLGEDEIRQLLDPPERRAAAEQPPIPAPAPPPVVEPTLSTAREPPPLMVEPDERDAIPPAPELRLVAETPASSAKAEAPPERSSASLPTTIDQIIDYWDSLRGSQPVPALDALDRGLVRRSWPNCMLVAYGGAPKLTRIGEENGEIEYLEMVIHWILSRGQVAASRGEPMEEEKRFPVSDGNARYQLLLLPLANAEGKSDHVLCHLLRVKEAAKPKGFKRWLAS
ncbi:MAG TPA: hypothetical protein VN681_01070 [Stellaceae bacterium]|nr:hypothetical protein [Stellaceae bacterium]